MRSLIFGYVGLLWGGAVIGYGLTRGLDDSSGAYASGSVLALGLGVVLFCGGGWALLRRARSSA